LSYRIDHYKKFLKSRKPKKTEIYSNYTIIINQNGEQLRIENLIFNIYDKSELVIDALSQNFDYLQNDPSIEGYEITDMDERSLIRVDREDFEMLPLKREELIKGERILIKAATLNIIRLSFDAALKWDFYFKGNKISAKIKDSLFYQMIEKGESFTKGDILEVELQITQKWDDSVNTYMDKSYLITAILTQLSFKKGGRTS
jgi:hypothetical protein